MMSLPVFQEPCEKKEVITARVRSTMGIYVLYTSLHSLGEGGTYPLASGTFRRRAPVKPVAWGGGVSQDRKGGIPIPPDSTGGTPPPDTKGGTCSRRDRRSYAKWTRGIPPKRTGGTKCVQTCLVVFFQNHYSKTCLPFIVDLNPHTLHSSVAFAGSLTRKDPPSFILPRGVLFPCNEAFPSNSIFRIVCWTSVVCGPAQKMIKLSNIRL